MYVAETAPFNVLSAITGPKRRRSFPCKRTQGWESLIYTADAKSYGVRGCCISQCIKGAAFDVASLTSVQSVVTSEPDLLRVSW